MSKPKGLLNKYSRLVLLVIITGVVVYLISNNFDKFKNVFLPMSWNIFLALMGFSAVVFIHECGHFIVAKLSDIKVETFSIFLPPVLLGVRRTEEGLRFRILPKFFPKENDPDGDGLLSFTVGKKGRAGETEYRIGLIPLAGYVKMLGQEDTGADKQIDDPRAFPNKSIGVRMAVISAGVIFNVIAAIGILMMVYLIGIDRMPAVVGGVRPGSPAAQAGLQAGDEIIEIAGKNDNLDFGNILMAAALSDKGEKVALKVKHTDGSIENVTIEAEQMSGMPLRLFGILSPQTLTIAEVSAADANALLARTGLLPGDRIKAVNGRDVQTNWQLERIVQNAFVPAVTVLAERTDAVSKEVELIKSQIQLDLNFAKGEVKAESDLGHIYSMVPRLQIKVVNTGLSLQSGDIILAAGNVENPTYKELRDVTEEYKDKELPIKVLRTGPDGTEKTLTVTVVPKQSRPGKRVVIGIVPVLDAEHPVVAKTITAKDGPAALAIPRGASITAVDGVSVANFYDIIKQLRKNAGQRVTIDYRLNEEIAGDVVVDLGKDKNFVAVESAFAEFVPFKPMERLYKADGPVNALVMGSKKSVWFIVKTYVTLKGLFNRNVSLDAMSGPVGIATMTYQAVKHSFVSFLYLLAFISANLAVINFLPIPVVDGGVFVLLIVEKIKGGPVSIQVQEVITYAGLIFLGAVFLYFTYNDIVRLIFGG